MATATFQSSGFQTDAFQITDAPGPASQISYHPRRQRRPRLSWTIEGLPVDLEDWRANVLAFGGYDRMEGIIPERVLRRRPGSIDVGACITAYDPAGSIVWQGDLSEPPKISNALAALQAEGPISRARRARDRVLHQSRDYGGWVTKDSDPHNFGNNSEWTLDSAGGKLYWLIPNGTSITQNDQAGFIRWFQGALPRRIAGTIAGHASGNFELQLYTGIGPAGAPASRATLGLGTMPATFDWSWTPGSDDYVKLLIRRTGATATAAVPIEHRITGLRVNDRASGDDVSTSALAADLGGLLGYDTSEVVSSGFNGLPFDLANPSSWAEDGLFYLAALTDWRCLVRAEDPERRAGPVLDFGPWSRRWRFLRQANAVPDLRSVPPYNRVVVNYHNAAGRDSRVVLEITDPDPLAGTPLAGQKRDWVENLADAQPDETLATAVAEYLKPRVSATQLVGRIEIVAARAADGTGHVYSPCGGDVGELLDWGPAESKTLRIHEAEYRPDGATLGIEAPVSAAGLMAGIALQRAREGHAA